MTQDRTAVLTRRAFLHTTGTMAAAGSLLSAVPLASAAASPDNSIAEVSLDLNRIHKWNNSNGDTWDPFWADDGNLYAFNCDGRGFGVTRENLAFNGFAGDGLETLAGRSINPMLEYGKAGQQGPDRATWKACGQECIDGVFYAFVSRNVYGRASNDPLLRQTAFNSSLVKSEDRGRSWTRGAAENYARPMWPGNRFGAPFFIHYGQNGGQVEADRAREFVYAVSTNGFWNDGNDLVLGRVPRRELSRLDASAWSYYRGGNGMDDASWTANVYESSPILARPAKCGQTPITWVPALNRYLLISWYNAETLTRWFKPTEMVYDFYAAPHPWGPWSPLASFSDRFLAPGSHMYGPSLCAKYQAAHQDEVIVHMFTAGCPFGDVSSGIYKCWTIPVRLRTAPLPAHSAISWNAPSIRRQGSWAELPAWPDCDNAALESSHPGAALELPFRGTGIELLARKATGYGTLSVLVDNRPDATILLGTEDFPEISGVSVYRTLALPAGQHSLRMVNAGGGPVNLQAVTVYR